MADVPVSLARRQAGHRTTQLLLVLVLVVQLVSLALDLGARRDVATWQEANCAPNLGSAFPATPDPRCG